MRFHHLYGLLKRRWLAALFAAFMPLAACHARPVQDWQLTHISGHLPDLQFALSDDHGARVTPTTYRGDVVLLYFGYTGCGTQCPVTMARFSHLLRGDRHVRFLFATVTPETDRPLILHAYLSAYEAQNLVGLTGKKAALRALARRYRAAYPSGSGPNLAHSNLIYVFDPQGRARLLIRPGDSDQAILHDLHRLERDQ